jgi:hypothetical protein
MSNPIKKLISPILGRGGDAAGATPLLGKLAQQRPGGEETDAIRAARRRPLSQLSSKSGRQSNILSTATTLG